MAELSSEQQKALMPFIGRRVLLKGNHPHKGRKGRITQLDKTIAGYAFLVKLEGEKWPSSCYVYSPNEVVLVSGTVNDV